MPDGEVPEGLRDVAFRPRPGVQQDRFSIVQPAECGEVADLRGGQFRATLSRTANQPGTPAINPITAGAPAGGTITFTLYGPGQRTTVALTSAPVAVNGDGTYGPVSFTPTAIGTYHVPCRTTLTVLSTNRFCHPSKR